MILGMRRYRILLHGRGDARWLRQLERQRRVEREGAHMAALRAGRRGASRQRTQQGIHGGTGQGPIVWRRRGTPGGLMRLRVLRLRTVKGRDT